MPKDYSKDLKIIFAGFGGQGLLFAGKIVAQAGLLDGKEVSWLPSYGPEMRGGTCNCSVTVSTDPVGSPLVVEPDVVVAMNQPSVYKFIDAVVPGGLMIVDSTLVPDIPERDDIAIVKVPSTQLADEAGFKQLANVILTGKLYAETKFCSKDAIDAALTKIIPARKAKLLEPNQKALAMGMDF